MTLDVGQELEERFVRYARIDTQADESSATTPSTEKQFDLLKLLVEELREIGAQDVRLTDYGAVLATIPSTVAGDVPTVAFLAHVDTSPGFSGTAVEPIVHRGYDGGDIVLPDDPTQVLSPEQFPYLGAKGRRRHHHRQRDHPPRRRRQGGCGHHHGRWPTTCCTIPTSPTDRCGSVSRRMRRSGAVSTPICRTTCKPTSPTRWMAPSLVEIVYETFSADKAVVTIHGVSAHPGQAKDVLVNALHLAAKIINTLPHATLTPETTSDRQGFHPPLPDERHGGGGRAALHPARFRTGWSAGPRRVAAAGLRRRPGHRAARSHHLRDHTAISQHALLAGR